HRKGSTGTRHPDILPGDTQPIEPAAVSECDARIRAARHRVLHIGTWLPGRCGKRISGDELLSCKLKPSAPAVLSQMPGEISSFDFVGSIRLIRRVLLERPLLRTRTKQELAIMIEVFQQRAVVAGSRSKRKSIGNDPEPVSRRNIAATVAEQEVVWPEL